MISSFKCDNVKPTKNFKYEKVPIIITIAINIKKSKIKLGR